MQPLLETICSGRNLSRQESQQFFENVIRGECHPATLAAALIALKIKGEACEEIAGAANALRSNALPFERPDYLFADCCGTGGDGAGTLNVSTAVAFVLAGCGLPVAKHGNRAVSSRSGSADVLEHLGIRLDPSPAQARHMLDEAGFCFLFAPQYHAGIRHAMPVRRELATRTLFNLLGPLSHPASPPAQLLGVYDASLCRLVAETLRALGCEYALVVNGDIDEIAIHGNTHVARLHDGDIETFTIEPEQAGITRQPLDSLKGGDVASNAEALLRILSGETDSTYAHAVALNAGALLWSVGIAGSLRTGFEQALECMASGKARQHLDAAIRISRHDAPAEGQRQ